MSAPTVNSSTIERIWLQHYPPGVPADIDPRRYASLKDMFEQSCARFAVRPAFTNMGVSLSFAELDRLSLAFAAWLQQVAGLQKGERVAIMLPNLLQYPVALFGALRAGLVVVNVNPLYTARELQFQLADSGAAAVVVLENFAHTLQQALPGTAVRHVVTTQVGDLFPPAKRWLVNFAVKYLKRLVPSWHIPAALSFRRALHQGGCQVLQEVEVGPADIALLQYTGGTTGVAKGAVLSHGNLVANLEQTSAWIGGTFRESEETVVTPLPLYHIFALTANLLTFVKWGGNNLLITNPRDVTGFLRELEKTRFTVITGVNTLFDLLLRTHGLERIKQANGNTLKLAVAGGMAVQRGVAERWQALMGVPLVEGYGLTEAAPIVCANRVDAQEFSGTIGLPLPSTLVVIFGDDGEVLPLGETGEICIKGPQVMQGYWNRPDETALAFTADGWLRTGDIGVMNGDGSIRFVERRKDVIVVSGFKAYPGEIEEVALRLPGVREAAAIGVPDPHSGESVKLFLVRQDPNLDAAAVRVHCRASLAPYKVPKHVEFRDSLPKTPVGKILRRALKEETDGAIH